MEYIESKKSLQPGLALCFKISMLKSPQMKIVFEMDSPEKSYSILFTK